MNNYDWQNLMKNNMKCRNWINCLLFVVIDAMGKLPPGLSEGNLYWVGQYPMCQGIAVVYNNTESPPGEEREFKGEYCRIAMDTIKVICAHCT